MKRFHVCAMCGRKWTDAEATLLPQSDSTAPRPMCCGFPITQEAWEGDAPDPRNLGRAAEFIQNDSLEMQAEVYRPIREFEATLKEGKGPTLG